MGRKLFSELDKLEKKVGLAPVTFTSKSLGPSSVIPTGSLTLDLIMGGGVPYGRFVVYSGLESSGKSTVLYSTLLQILLNEDKYRKTLCLFFDHEGTLTFDYLAAIAWVSRSRLERLFQDRVRYYEPDVGDVTLKLIREVLRRLPQIRQIKNQWYEVYPKSLKDKEVKEILEEADGQHDATLTKATGQLHVPIERPYPTLVAFIDSLAAMFPASMEENVESDKPGTKASMFSKWMPAVKPLLSSRNAIIIATNQIRERPMVMYGSPYYEPGGNAIKFFSDIRVKINTCSVPHGRGQVEEIGPNSYRYSKVQTIKNKVFVPYRESYLRIWFSDARGRSRGIDPVWDVLTYLKETHQVRRSKGQLKLLLPPPFQDLLFTEEEFHQCVVEPINLFLLGKLPIPNEKVRKIAEAYKESTFLTPKQRAYIHRYSIQAACRKQIESKEAMQLYFKDEEED